MTYNIIHYISINIFTMSFDILESQSLNHSQETKKEEKKVAPANLPVGGNVPVTAIPSSAGKTFRVQIGAFTSKPKTLNGVPELSTVVLDNGITKCFSGNFATYEAAAKRKKELID